MAHALCHPSVVGNNLCGAFLVAINQSVALIGANRLLPIQNYLGYVSHALGSAGVGFARLPSVFWLWHSDTAILTAGWAGFILSCIVATGYANIPILTTLWFLYMSFVHAGQDWYGYGWEIQLTEAGFLAIFYLEIDCISGYLSLGRFN